MRFYKMTCLYPMISSNFKLKIQLSMSDYDSQGKKKETSILTLALLAASICLMLTSRLNEVSFNWSP